MTLEAAQKIVYRELGIWEEGPIEPCCGRSHADPMPPLTDGLLAVILRRLGEDAETSAQADKALWHIFRVVRYKQTDLLYAAVMAFAQYLEARK